MNVLLSIVTDTAFFHYPEYNFKRATQKDLFLNALCLKLFCFLIFDLKQDWIIHDIAIK